MKSLMVCLMGLMVFVQAGTVQQPTVSGQVRLSDGLPVAGAQVMLFDLADLRRGVVTRTTTDESGNFALPLVPLGASLPEGFGLGQNYPNPFNPSTIIPYQLAATAQVRLEVFNTLGQRMATLVNGEQGAGTHSAQWDGTDAAGRAAAAGMYLYRLTVDGVEQTGRMVLVDGQAGVPMAGGSTEALPMAEGPSSAYGLVVSGLGLVTYVDADFGVEAGMGPVDVEVEAWQNVRMKVAQTPNGILGDVNNNGQVDIDDGLLVAAYYANSSTPMPNNGDISLGDVNCNGQVDLTDARLITTYIINPSDPSVQSLSIGQAGGCDTPDGGGSPEATKMYWADGGRSEQKIQRANLDGSQVEDVVTGLGGIDGLALDASGGKIYWTERSDKKIRRANLDGSQVEDVVTGLDQPIEVALDVSRDKIYWVDYSRGKIQCANLDGSQVEDLISANGPHGIALDVSRGKIYWVAYGKIQRANLDGSQVEDLVTGVNWSPSGIALDVSGGKMYWTDSRNNKIQRSNLDGSQVEDLVTGLDEPRQVALDVSGGKLYWTEAAGGTIGRSNLDGSQVEDLVTGLGYPRGIALDIPFLDDIVPPSDREVLVALYNATNGAQWKDNTNWLSDEPLDQWHGVTTDADGRVQTLDLSYNDLTGSIPPELGNLTNLKWLDLSYNDLTGSIPPELGNLTNLEGLDLGENQLSGSIPPELGNLTNLQGLRLGGNPLTGSIPVALGNLTNLEGLGLFENQLSGSIPPELGNLTNLQGLGLFENQLSGSIPPELGNLTNLEVLLLQENQLSGSIPPELGNLTNLGELYLTGNQLTGCIPAGLRDIPENDLSSLGLDDCSAADAPDLVVTASAPSSVTAGQSFTLSATVSNRGTAASAETTIHYYRSSDETIGDDNDTQVGRDQEVSSLAAGTSTGELETPVTAPDTADTYYYGACVDAVSGDSNRNNDCSPGVQVNVIVQADLPDLQIASGDVVDGNDEPTPGSTIKLEFTVRNSKSASVSAPETILRYYMSDNETLDANDQTIGDITISALGVGEKREVVTDNITVPSPYIETAYYYFACLDPDNLISERDETDNCSDEVVIDVAGSGPADLAVINPWVSKYDISPSDTLRFYVTVRNLGPATTPKDIEGIVTYYYSSNNSTWNPVLTSRGEKSQTEIRDELEPEKDDEENRKIKVPSTEGTYYYRACVEIENEDPNSDNNCSDSVGVNVRTGASGLPDLIVKNPEVGNSDSASGNLSAGDEFRMRVTLVNEGSVVPAKNFKLIYYRSNDNVWSNDDTREYEESIGASTLPPRDVDGDRKSTVITVPSTAGTYYYIACVDPQNNIPESNENNNCASVTIYVGAPDLFFESAIVSNPSPVEGGDIKISVRVKNRGPGEAFDAELKYYRSNDNTLDTTNDTYLGETHDYTISSLSPDDSPKEHSTFPFAAPSTAGTYYYFACVETTGDSNPSNNCSQAMRVDVKSGETPPPPPTAPTAPIARNAGKSAFGQNKVAWSRVPDATYYEVYHCGKRCSSDSDEWSDEDEKEREKRIDQPANTNASWIGWTDPTSDLGGDWYKVKACNDNGCSEFSNEVVFDIKLEEIEAFLEFNNDNYELSWQLYDTARDHFSYYKIYRASSESYIYGVGSFFDSDLIHTTDILSDYRWKDTTTGRKAGWYYAYRVQGCNSVGCTEETTRVVSSSYPGDPKSPPNPPLNLVGGTLDNDIIWLDWEPPSSGTSVTHYEVWHKSRSGGEYSLKGKQVIDTYWYDTDPYGDPADSIGDDYYRVKACNNKGCSDFSDEVKI